MEGERTLGLWSRYLTLWVALCILAGIVLGEVFPEFFHALAGFEVAHISIPIAICLFWMIYPIMVQISFEDVRRAMTSPKPIATTLFMNWAIKPFTMAFFAWLFLSVLFGGFLTPAESTQYRAGLILLGVAPCTAMVLVWSYLAEGNMGHTLVMTAINSLSMVVLYAPLAMLLLGISGIVVPWQTIALAVVVYILTPLVVGWLTRSMAIKKKGTEWFERRLVPRLTSISIAALLITLVVLFSFQGGKILDLPLIIGMITVPIFVNILVVFALTYLLSKVVGLGYEDAAPTTLIAGSNHFEVAIAVATTLFGVASGAALATVVGVLTEVPIMLFLVYLCRRTRGFFTCATPA